MARLPRSIRALVGTQGPAGPVGPTGAGVEDITIDTFGHLIITMSDGSEIDAGNVVTSSGVPVLTGAPTIDAPVEGVACVCTTGSWSNIPTGFSYQWLLDDVAISGQTTNSYTPTAGDVMGTLSCRVIAANATGSSELVETDGAVVAMATVPLRTFKVSATDPAATYTTIAAVNAATFLPGDAILFKGGETFSGALVVPSSGDSSDRITFGSYGGGRATISSGTSKGCYALNKAYVDVRDLIFVGAGGATNSVQGVHFENNQAGNTKLAGPHLLNLDVSSYGSDGIKIHGTNGSSGFDGAQVRYCDPHGNTGSSSVGTSGAGGIYFKSGAAYLLGTQAHTNALVEYCNVYGNTGSSVTGNWTGAGIVMADTSDGVIRNNTAYQNGALSQCASGGPVGIFLFNALRCTIQDNVSYSNKGTVTALGNGDGFDLDIGCKDCIVERNLAYGNDGAGFLLYSGNPDAVLQQATGNVFRNNISILNNVGLQGAGEISLVNLDSRATTIDIYDNTLYHSHGYGSIYILRYSGAGQITAKIANNILANTHSTGFSLYEDVDAGVSTAAGITLRGNCYAVRGRIAYFNSDVYRSIDGFLAAETTQEKVSSTVVATSAEPKFASPDTLTAAAYQLQTGSPLADIGIDLSAVLSITAPTTDYFGNARPGSAVAIGAHETVGQSTASEAEINATYTVSSTEPAYGDPVADPTIMRNGTFTDPSSWGALNEGSSSSSEWIKADLGSTKTVTKIQVAPRGSSIALRAAKVEISTDGTTWTYVGRVYGTAASTLANFPIGSRQARYVRLMKDYDTVNGTYESRFLVVGEFRIFGY